MASTGLLIGGKEMPIGYGADTVTARDAFQAVTREEGLSTVPIVSIPLHTD